MTHDSQPPRRDETRPRTADPIGTVPPRPDDPRTRTADPVSTAPGTSDPRSRPSHTTVNPPGNAPTVWNRMGKSGWAIGAAVVVLLLLVLLMF